MSCATHQIARAFGQRCTEMETEAANKSSRCPLSAARSLQSYPAGRASGPHFTTPCKTTRFPSLSPLRPRFQLPVHCAVTPRTHGFGLRGCQSTCRTCECGQNGATTHVSCDAKHDQTTSKRSTLHSVEIPHMWSVAPERFLALLALLALT